MFIDLENVDQSLEDAIIKHAQNSLNIGLMDKGTVSYTEQEFKDLAKETAAIENEVVEFLKQRPREMAKMFLSLNLRLYIQEEKLSLFIQKLQEVVKEKPDVKKS